MELVIKSYKELSTDELYEILKVRAQVFVMEQNCVYCDLDDKDKDAYHVFYRDDDGIQAYLRVLNKGVSFDEVSIGRVISLKRRCGLATKLLLEGIRVAQEKYGADSIRIEAQTYARALYEKVGFQQISDEFFEDGIPHVQMMWRENNDVR